MNFTFDYEETLVRRIVIEAEDLADAIQRLHRKIDDKEIVLDTSDFVSGEIRMPQKHNFLPQAQCYGEPVEDAEYIDIVVDMW